MTAMGKEVATDEYNEDAIDNEDGCEKQEDGREHENITRSNFQMMRILEQQTSAEPAAA